MKIVEYILGEENINNNLYYFIIRYFKSIEIKLVLKCYIK